MDATKLLTTLLYCYIITLTGGTNCKHLVRTHTHTHTQIDSNATDIADHVAVSKHYH
jgi:hypothetical protein